MGGSSADGLISVQLKIRAGWLRQRTGPALRQATQSGLRTGLGATRTPLSQAAADTGLVGRLAHLRGKVALNGDGACAPPARGQHRPALLVLELECERRIEAHRRQQDATPRTSGQLGSCRMV